MKRFISFFMLLMLVLGMTACNKVTEPAAAPDRTAASAAESTPEPEIPAAAQTAVPQPEAEQTVVPEAAQATVLPAEDETAAAAGGKLAPYQGIFSGNSFYMQYLVFLEQDGEQEEVGAEFAVQGDEIAIVSKVQGMDIHAVITEGKLYLLDAESKTAVAMSLDEDVQGLLSIQDMQPFPTEGYTLIGSGNDEFFGETLAYEDYSVESGEIRFYFNGDEMAGFETTMLGSKVLCQVQSISETIPEGMFDIPDEYEITDFGE